MKLKSGLYFIALLLLTFFAAEFVLRQVIEVDIDGNKRIGYRHLKPFKSPVLRSTELLKNIRSRKNQTIQFSEVTGWQPFNTYNSDGIRTAFPISEKKDSNTVRIALIGDSYVWGAGVQLNETFGGIVDSVLSTNQKVEVLNFGCGGFGIDQAFLRYKHIATEYSPDIVIVGLQPENVFRNTNLIRAFYNMNEALPYFKPRYVLDNDSLRLINFPVPDSDSLIRTLQSPESWPLIQYENYYTKEDFDTNRFKFSTLAFLNNLIEQNRFSESKREQTAFNSGSEEFRITQKLIERFDHEAQQNNHHLAFLFLPRKQDIELLITEQENHFDYNALLKKVSPSFIDPSHELLNAEFSQLFLSDGHYSEIGHRILAKSVFDYINNLDLR